MSSPLIAWFPGKIKANTIEKGTAHLVDLAPTFYEVAGAKYPAVYNGNKINPLIGKSLTGLFFKGEPINRERPLFWELWGNRAIREGKWKLVSYFPANQWELYDMDTDRGETNNLAAKNPAIVSKLSLEYLQWVNQNDVVLDFNLIKPKAIIDIKVSQ